MMIYNKYSITQCRALLVQPRTVAAKAIQRPTVLCAPTSKPWSPTNCYYSLSKLSEVMAFESCTVVLFHLLRRMLRPLRDVNVPGSWSAYSSASTQFMMPRRMHSSTSLCLGPDCTVGELHYFSYWSQSSLSYQPLSVWYSRTAVVCQ